MWSFCVFHQSFYELHDCDAIIICSPVVSPGKEWDYVIISCVSGLLTQHIEKRPSKDWLRRNLGSIGHKDVITTAITRARKGLVIIGTIQA